MKTIGIIPARMAASRFPGKPLHPIAGRPMLEHCYLRAGLTRDGTSYMWQLATLKFNSFAQKIILIVL